MSYMINTKHMFWSLTNKMMIFLCGDVRHWSPGMETSWCASRRERKKTGAGNTGSRETCYTW